MLLFITKCAFLVLNSCEDLIPFRLVFRFLQFLTGTKVYFAFVVISTVVGDNINIMKTTFSFKFLLLTSFFRTTRLQLNKESFFVSMNLCFRTV